MPSAIGDMVEFLPSGSLDAFSVEVTEENLSWINNVVCVFVTHIDGSSSFYGYERHAGSVMYTLARQNSNWGFLLHSGEPPLAPAAADFPRDTIRNWAQAHRLPVTDTVWCANRPAEYLPEVPLMPLRYGGYYRAVHKDRSEDRWVYTNDTRYTCGHCATVAAFLASPTREYSCMLEFPGVTVSGYRPSVGELDNERPSIATIKDFDAADVADLTAARNCGHCGRYGHNARTCPHPHKTHMLIGIEIEGKWRNLRDVKRRADDAGLTHCSDGSVRGSPTDGVHGHEFQTKPASLKEAIGQLIEFYPDETDGSCGMHVHVSFPAVVVGLLNTPEFFRYHEARWRQWGVRMNLHPDGRFFSRLMGENDYCKKNVRTFNIASDSRYAQLNFSSWNEHKTVECRLLPMFHRSSLAVSAVCELIDIFERFIENASDLGLIMPDVTVGVQCPGAIQDAASVEMPLPSSVTTSAASLEIELRELLPPADGMVRIAVPNGLPIYLSTIVDALATRRTA